MLPPSEWQSEQWSLALTIASCVGSFIYGMYRREHLRIWPIIALGMIVNVIVSAYIRGGGFRYFEGFIFLPLICFVACLGGVLLRVIYDFIGSLFARHKA